jgi:SAM-dependent methyltransferase
MPFFKKYSDYYDTFYADKDYAAECNFIEAIFVKYAQQSVRTILDLGCGTGGHDFQLAQRGYVVYGVDRSADMLAIAQQKKAKIDRAENITFQKADFCSVNLDTQFDAAISMFAVMSYMTGNNDLQKALRTARRHIHSNGLFIFDAWYGPGVLSDPPVDRFKIFPKEKTRILRLVHPVVDIVRHVVEVNYKLLILEGEKLVSEEDETHTMRFFFPQEIIYHLESAGFEVLCLCPFMDLERGLNECDWNFSVVAKVA